MMLLSAVGNAYDLEKTNSFPVWSWICLWYMYRNSAVTVWQVEMKCSGVRTFIGLGLCTIEGENGA